MAPDHDTSSAFDFPRLSALLEQMDEPLGSGSDASESLPFETLLVDQLVPVDRVRDLITDTTGSGALHLEPVQDEVRDLHEVGEPDEIEQMLESMRLRDVAREALRARMIAFGEGRQHRSTYESVFLMLAFAVMVLVAAPPLIDILLAARGIKP